MYYTLKLNMFYVTLVSVHIQCICTRDFAGFCRNESVWLAAAMNSIRFACAHPLKTIPLVRQAV